VSTLNFRTNTATTGLYDSDGADERARWLSRAGSLLAVQDGERLSDAEKKARIAYVLRVAMAERQLTPPKLAKLVGRSRSTVLKWLKPQETVMPKTSSLFRRTRSPSI
jgi:hypothetical protein